MTINVLVNLEKLTAYYRVAEGIISFKKISSYNPKIKDMYVIIPLADEIEDESYSKEQLLEMFITDLLDTGYNKIDIREMLEHGLQHRECWMSSVEIKTGENLASCQQGAPCGDPDNCPDPEGCELKRS
jgi:hypothetical protein